MNSLFTKISLALFVIIGITASAFFLVNRASTNLYYEELTQRLNASIAMYVTNERSLLKNGEPDLDSLAELAQQAMIINPTAEIYLLDTKGKILGHALPEKDVVRSGVALAPIRELMGGDARLPLRGDDPRSNSSRKVFSAAEVRSEGELQGYLYVILGGRTYETLSAEITGSYVRRDLIVAFVAIVVTALAIGMLVFRLLTRRLRALNAEMRRVSASRFEAAPTLPIPPANGDEIDELSAAFIEMSERIQSQLRQLQENDSLRRELISNISHDLRTPLSAMHGYLETLIIKDDTLPKEERKHYLKTARRHTLRLNSLIGDLFELSKLESDSVTPNLETFSVHELLQDVSQQFELAAQSKEIHLCMEMAQENAQTVGDIGLIQRVLENLVRNAIQFTPEGGQITLSVARRPASVAVAVTDNGCGIPDEDLSKIFDRHYQSASRSAGDSGSSGLGLAIVKRILDLHSSRITVTSKVNTGSRFEFELPLVQRAA